MSVEAELLALAVWQVSKWSRHLDGGFAENATGSNWPATAKGDDFSIQNRLREGQMVLTAPC
jgi:hypothetical protein